MARWRLRKSGFRFNAWHSFPDDSGYDARPHGHDYEFSLLLEATVCPQGMLYDARRLKQLVADEVISRLDHQNLNDLLPQPSSEMLAEWIWRQLRPHLPPELKVGIELWETRSIAIEYWGDEEKN